MSIKQITSLLALLASLWAGAIAAAPWMAEAASWPILGAVWFYLALVFALSLARAAVRKSSPPPDEAHRSWLSVRGLRLALLLALHPFAAHAAPPSVGTIATNRVLIIDRSSTAVSGGKATLS